MIIRLKEADFSENNVGKIYLKGVNLNIGEGTNNPLLFTGTYPSASSEFVGVKYETVDNPSPYAIVRQIEKGSNGGNYLYSYKTADRTSIEFPKEPQNLSMAIWINKTSWEAFQTSGHFYFFMQVYDGEWKNIWPSEGYADYIRYDQLLSNNEFSTDRSNTYFSYTVKRKKLAKTTINGNEWVCIGIIFDNIVLNTSTYQTNCRPRIAFNFSGILTSTTHLLEIGNLQVVETNNYLDPTKDYQ